jgi:hypothetical protein
MDWWDNPVTTDGTASPLESWGDRACLGSDLVLWYGPAEDGPGSYEEPDDQRLWRERRAIQICTTTCSVLEQCLAVELTLPLADQHGVRGGMTAQQRRGLLARQRRERRVTRRAAADLGAGPCGPEAA